MIRLKKTCILKGLLKSNRKLQVHVCAYIVLYDYVKYLQIKSMVKYNRQVYKNGNQYFVTYNTYKSEYMKKKPNK